jgi:hypothetical protein
MTKSVIVLRLLTAVLAHAHCVLAPLAVINRATLRKHHKSVSIPDLLLETGRRTLARRLEGPRRDIEGGDFNNRGLSNPHTHEALSRLLVETAL